MALIQTVLGPVAPGAIGFTLPHEHTRCVLWQIPNRWDYWELTGEDELILPELACFRELGGTALVDVTLSGIGRDPRRLRRLAEASEPRLIPLLCDLLAQGFADRILLSQDVCHNEQLRHYGGNGYTYMQEAFMPRLRAAGVSAAEIDQMTIANPRRILTLGAGA